MSSISIVIGDRYFSKDPLSSELGKRIIHHGLSLMDQLGYEHFTFKKLADKIDSTEASIYRYFENKQKVLIYLNTWYWSWVDYQIDFDTHHLTNPMERLTRSWEILCHLNIVDVQVSVDISALRRVVISESDKTYLTKDIDQINEEGLFDPYKALCHRIAEQVLEIRSEYKYSHALVSTLMEASHQQFFFANHLPSLTEVDKSLPTTLNRQVHSFIMDTITHVVK